MKVESTEFAGRVDVGYQGNTGVRDDPKEFGLSNHNNNNIKERKGKSCYHMRQKE